MSKKNKKYLDDVETLIGTDTVFKGNIISNKTIKIDGKIIGNIEQSEGVIIGEKAYVKGNITAKYVIVGGKIEGNITANEGMELLDKSIVKGNIQTTILSVSEGAFFEGKSTMIKQEDTKEDTDTEELEEEQQQELIDED